VGDAGPCQNGVKSQRDGCKLVTEFMKEIECGDCDQLALPAALYSTFG